MPTLTKTIWRALLTAAVLSTAATGLAQRPLVVPNYYSFQLTELRPGEEVVGELTDDVRLLDLAEYPLPLCDGKSCYEVAEVQQVAELVASARGAIIVSPIYNYDVNAAAKNFIDPV